MILANEQPQKNLLGGVKIFDSAWSKMRLFTPAYWPVMFLSINILWCLTFPQIHMSTACHATISENHECERYG